MKIKCSHDQAPSKGVCLYNLIFPIWTMPVIFVLSPVGCLIAAAANFLIDSLVLWFSMNSAGVQQIKKKKKVWKSSILRIFLIGFLSDFLGAFFAMILAFFVTSPLLRFLSSHFSIAIMISDYSFPDCIFWALPGVIAAGVLIYWLNKKFSFRRCREILTAAQIRRLALFLAWITAPYVMFIPTDLFF